MPQRAAPPCEKAQAAERKYRRSAWTLGLAMAGTMTVITNAGIRGWLPRSICLVCLTLMWLESALGLCLGCEIHAQLVRRGWARKDEAFEICAHGACEVRVAGRSARVARRARERRGVGSLLRRNR